MIPITPGGLGFVEAGLTGVLTLAGVTPEHAVLATLLYRLFSYWLPAPRRARGVDSVPPSPPRTRGVTRVSQEGELPPTDLLEAVATGGTRRRPRLDHCRRDPGERPVALGVVSQSYFAVADADERVGHLVDRRRALEDHDVGTAVEVDGDALDRPRSRHVTPGCQR